MSNAVEGRVKAIIVEQLGVKEEEISLEKALVDDLGADSLDMVGLVLAMEQEFGLNISDEESGSIRTVGDAVGFIQAHKV